MHPLSFTFLKIDNENIILSQCSKSIHYLKQEIFFILNSRNKKLFSSPLKTHSQTKIALSTRSYFEAIGLILKSFAKFKLCFFRVGLIFGEKRYNRRICSLSPLRFLTIGLCC